MIMCVVIFIGWAIYLDVQVVEKFSGKKWSVPAKVYARPFELFIGGQIARESVVDELKRLGYREEYLARDAGTYHISPSRMIIYTRGFQFWDGREKANRIEISFQGQYIQNIVNLRSNKSVDLVRLEPMMIGGIYPQHQEDRVLVSIDKVPPLLIDTLIAVEDRNFAHHWGVSLRGTLRALFVNVTSGKLAQGGSTLTQQLVKNFYLTSERTLSRKAQEAVMAFLLELHFSKQEILEAYLNEVYLGQQGNHAIHGFGLASQFYFGRPLAELKPQHIALLVGMVKGPSTYNPRRHPERSQRRRDQVLQIMQEQNLIAMDDYEKYKNRSLGVLAESRYRASRYPAFMQLVKKQLASDYKEENLQTEGLRIFTTMDPAAQQAAEESVIAMFKQFTSGKSKELQTSVVVTQPQNGEVLAVVSDRNPRYPGYNRALDAQRQIGSVVKPFVYLTALERGYTLASPIEDYPIDIKSGKDRWRPQNFDKQSHGIVWLKDALAYSYNLATARLGLEVGVRHVAETLYKASHHDKIPEVASLLLGAVEMSAYEVAGAYQTIASGGFKSDLRVIREVLDAYGRQLNRYPLQSKQVFDQDDVYLLTSAMQDVVRFGTARRINNIMPESLNLAGKTGTSDDLRDSWFVGFSGNYLAAVWVGRDDNKSTGLTGSSGALPIWIELMRKLPQQPLLPTLSDNIVYNWVDPGTSLITDADCPGAIAIPMRVDTMPEERTSCHSGNGAPGWIERMLKRF